MFSFSVVLELVAIGFVAISWILALLLKFSVPGGRLTWPEVWEKALQHGTELGVLAILCAYCLGSLMNSLCHTLRLIGLRRFVDSRVLRGTDQSQFSAVYAYVAQRSSEQHFRVIQDYLPFLRISRACGPNLLILGAVLATMYSCYSVALVAFCASLCSLAAYCLCYYYWKKEIANAYKCLRQIDSTGRDRTGQIPQPIV